MFFHKALKHILIDSTTTYNQFYQPLVEDEEDLNLPDREEPKSGQFT